MGNTVNSVFVSFRILSGLLIVTLHILKLKIVLKMHFALVKVGREQLGHVHIVLASYTILVMVAIILIKREHTILRKYFLNIHHVKAVTKVTITVPLRLILKPQKLKVTPLKSKIIQQTYYILIYPNFTKIN